MDGLLRYIGKAVERLSFLVAAKGRAVPSVLKALRHREHGGSRSAEDPSQRQVWRLTHVFTKVRNAALTGCVKSYMKDG